MAAKFRRWKMFDKLSKTQRLACIKMYFKNCGSVVSLFRVFCAKRHPVQWASTPMVILHVFSFNPDFVKLLASINEDWVPGVKNATVTFLYRFLIKVKASKDSGGKDIISFFHKNNRTKLKRSMKSFSVPVCTENAILYQPIITSWSHPWVKDEAKLDMDVQMTSIIYTHYFQVTSPLQGHTLATINYITTQSILLHA